MRILEAIQQQIDLYARIGHPALMENFILRNGSEGVVIDAEREQATPKECFKNATEAALRTLDSVYVEGFFMRPDLPILIHHAWIEVDGFVVDNTILNNEDAQYFGVAFEREEMLEETMKNEVYGLLATPMINIDLMVRRDPGIADMLNKAQQNFSM